LPRTSPGAPERLWAARLAGAAAVSVLGQFAVDMPVLGQQRQSLLGLLAVQLQPAALLGMDGSLVASTFSESDNQTLGALSGELRARGRDTDASGARSSVALGLDQTRSVEATPLEAPGGRAVGWLVRLQAPGQARRGQSE